MPSSLIRLLHRRLRSRGLLYRIPLTAIHRRLRQEWAHEQADWHHVPFQMKHVSISGTMMATFTLDDMPVNAPLQSALSNDILADHSEYSGVLFCVVGNQTCYEMRVISIATATSTKYYNPKSVSSFKVSLELFFKRIMQSHML